MTTLPIRALIAEDEPILAEALVQALHRLWPELLIGNVVNHGVAAVEEALTQRPDILFLDIRMPGKTGLEAARDLAEDWLENVPFPLIVFVTAYDTYALQAFEQAAVDYVLKPVTDDRLAKTVSRLQTQCARRQTGNANLEHLVQQLHALLPTPAVTTERLSLIRAAVGNQIRMIPVADVLYFEATDKYVNVVTEQGESLIRTSMKELLPQLDTSQFWQIHRSIIVNASCIQAALRDETGKLSVRLHHHDRMLPVSRLFAHLFKQM